MNSIALSVMASRIYPRCAISTKARAYWGFLLNSTLSGKRTLSPLKVSIDFRGPLRASQHLPLRSSFLRANRWKDRAANGLIFGRFCTEGGRAEPCRAAELMQTFRMLGNMARPGGTVSAIWDAGTPSGAAAPLLSLRRRLRAIKRLDPKVQRDVLTQGLGRPRCQRAQRLLKRGDAN